MFLSGSEKIFLCQFFMPRAKVSYKAFLTKRCTPSFYTKNLIRRITLGISYYLSAFSKKMWSILASNFLFPLGIRKNYSTWVQKITHKKCTYCWKRAVVPYVGWAVSFRSYQQQYTYRTLHLPSWLRLSWTLGLLPLHGVHLLLTCPRGLEGN